MSQLKIPEDLTAEYYLLEYQPPGNVRDAAYVRKLIERIAYLEAELARQAKEWEAFQKRIASERSRSGKG